MRGTRNTAIAMTVFGIVLSGCSSVADRQQRVLDGIETVERTASGVVSGVGEVMDAGAMVIDTAVDTAQDLEKRAQSVQEGVLKVQEGKQQIEEGLGFGD